MKTGIEDELYKKMLELPWNFVRKGEESLLLKIHCDKKDQSYILIVTNFTRTWVQVASRLEIEKEFKNKYSRLEVAAEDLLGLIEKYMTIRGLGGSAEVFERTDGGLDISLSIDFEGFAFDWIFSCQDLGKIAPESIIRPTTLFLQLQSKLISSLSEELMLRGCSESFVDDERRNLSLKITRSDSFDPLPFIGVSNDEVIHMYLENQEGNIQKKRKRITSPEYSKAVDDTWRNENSREGDLQDEIRDTNVASIRKAKNTKKRRKFL